MIKAFFRILFGDIGLIISALTIAVLSWIVFPKWVLFAKTYDNPLEIVFVILFGVFTCGFIASSTLSSITSLIKSINQRQWLILTLSIIVITSNLILIVFAII